ncbi:MAG: DUF1573 domain-containing protein [Candidatus Sumerlaeota bacterium]|nr:DUF1573 domain-containing protein [Candidatus Sumerlaeota bacterium]
MFFETRSQDLGETLFGSPVNTEYRFANRGTQPLRILGLKTSCSRCTAALPAKKELGAGESSSMRVQVNTKNLTGPLAYFINVKSNDPVEPTVALKLRFVIVPQVSWTPEELSLGKARPGRPAAGTVAIDCRTTAPLRLKRRPWNETLFDARIEEASPEWEAGGAQAGRKADDTEGRKNLRIQRSLLRCSVKAAAPPGEFFDTVAVETDNPLTPVISIPVSGSVVGAWELESNEVFLGILEPGAKVEKDVRLTLYDPGITVHQVTTNVQGLIVDPRPVPGGCGIHLAYQAPEAAGAIEGAVEIETNAASSPKASFAVRGMVKQRAR